MLEDVSRSVQRESAGGELGFWIATLQALGLLPDWRPDVWNPNPTFPRTPFNRPISAYFSGVLSFLASVTILTSRLARRSRRRRGEVSSTLRRNISRTCWAVRRESIRLTRSAEGGGA